MPLEIEPPRAAADRTSPAGEQALVVGLVNNMPDSALEGTEQLFSRLLASAATRWQVRLRFSFLAEVPRGPEARQRLSAKYWTLPDLLSEQVDALIVTGAEPRTPSLREEPYWDSLVRLLELAGQRTVSSIWSCLAAHAAVLHLDETERRRFPAEAVRCLRALLRGGHPLTRAPPARS